MAPEASPWLLCASRASHLQVVHTPAAAAALCPPIASLPGGLERTAFFGRSIWPDLLFIFAFGLKQQKSNLPQPGSQNHESQCWQAVSSQGSGALCAFASALLLGQGLLAPPPLCLHLPGWSKLSGPSPGTWSQDNSSLCFKQGLSPASGVGMGMLREARDPAWALLAQRASHG